MAQDSKEKNVWVLRWEVVPLLPAVHIDIGLRIVANKGALCECAGLFAKHCLFFSLQPPKLSPTSFYFCQLSQPHILIVSSSKPPRPFYHKQVYSATGIAAHFG